MSSSSIQPSSPTASSLLPKSTVSVASVDGCLNQPPSDSISSIAVNGSLTTPTNIIIAGSWDNTMNCYEVQSSKLDNSARNANLTLSTKGNAPVLCCDFASDGHTALFGDCEGILRKWNLQHGQQGVSQIGRHQQAIRTVKCLKDREDAILTGSWDKTMSVWDMRTSSPQFNFTLSERVYAMDANNNKIVVGTADRMIHVFDIRMGQKEKLEAQFLSPLQYQTRCISLFAQGDGFCVGSIEGRVHVEYFSDSASRDQSSSAGKSSQSFAFKCHRIREDIYCVNSIDFNSKYNTFVTAGSDGTVVFWDKKNRTKIATIDTAQNVRLPEGVRCPVVAAKFSPDSSMLFYACSYDWSKGYQEKDTTKFPNQIYIHNVLDNAIRPKQSSNSSNHSLGGSISSSK